MVASPLKPIDRLSLRLPTISVRLRRFRDLLELGADVVLLDEHVDRDALPAGVDDRFRDRDRVDLLDCEIQRRPCTADEVNDRLLEIVRGTELHRPQVHVDLVVGEALHASSSLE